MHRTSGDTERRYHLRYYKTGICVYDTDSRGFCVKNGQHCAFAHGVHDLRSPVYDIRELQAMDGYNGVSENGVVGNGDGLNNLDKERNALNEDPRWTDLAYVLACYKTELCKRPPRLCRQGYACPQYHNAKDKRRPPKKLKYRSTPCPNVKAGDEWGDPANCEAGDNCAYCHTRTEQQFHPEIYKSTKCNDVLQTSYCPRGPFCAFAHGDKEMQSRHELMNDDVELKHYNQPMNNGNNGSSHGHMNGHHAVSSATTISGRCHSKSVSIASSLPDHYPIHGMNNLHTSSSNGKNHITDTTFNSSASSQSGGMGSGDRGFSYQLGPIGSRPRSYSTSQANRATASNALDIFEHVLGRSTGHSSHSEQNNLMNGDMRSASIRRSSGIYDQSSSSLFTRGFGPNSSDLTQPGARTRSTLTDNYNTADTVGSVVESAIGEIDLPLDEIEAPFERMSCGNVSSMMNGNCADTLIEHHHPSHQNSSSFLNSTSTGNNSVANTGSLADTPAGLAMPGSAPVNIPGSRLNSERPLNLGNGSPPISSSPLTSSLGHSLGSFSLSPFCQQLAAPSQLQNSLNNAAVSSMQSDPCQLFKKMFFPRFNLFLIFSRILHYPESLTDVGTNMILQETYCKFEVKWKELLRDVNWNQKETACWINSNFPVMKEFAMGVFTRYSREIMVQDRAEKEVVDDDFMNQLLTSSSRSASVAIGINTSSKHMM